MTQVIESTDKGLSTAATVPEARGKIERAEQRRGRDEKKTYIGLLETKNAMPEVVFLFLFLKSTGWSEWQLRHGRGSADLKTHRRRGEP